MERQKMSDNNSDLGAFLAGFVIGGLVGAATALILAPQSGSETRTFIADRSNNLMTAGEDRMRHYRETAGEYTQEYRDRAEQAVESTRSLVQEVGGLVQVRDRIVLVTGKERASQVKDQVSTLVQRGNNEEEPPAADNGAANNTASTD
jgi:gas vesicle protein